jgi:peptidoglycan hydrolase-like protein with peptidoglycan-binding domain
VTTGVADATSSTSTLVTGVVNPNGATTTYYFEYGTSPNCGLTTPVTNVGVGTADVAVTTALTGLSPGDTYYYRLVAVNYLATVYGQSATFQTSAAPSVTSGAASALSATSESLTGSVNPNGSATTYYFEYGTTSSFGETTTVTDAGGGVMSQSVNATISGLTPGATYDYALVATSVLGKSVGATLTLQASASSCVSEQSVIAEDSLALTQAKDALSVDELGQGAAVAASETTLRSDVAIATSDGEALSLDEVSATNANTTITRLPAPGTRIRRGQAVYYLNDQPIPLFYGVLTLYRALSPGLSGSDVEMLNANLSALGFEHESTSEYFSAQTETAVKAWQSSLGESATGIVALGDVVVEPGAIEIASLSATNGQVVSGDMAILKATSRTPVVTVDLDVGLQGAVKVGDAVTITLPNNATTPGVVTSIGKVAVAPTSSSASSTPTITVEVTPTKLAAVGNYDQAPVNVSITNATVTNVLAVPIDSLLALANGGDAIEEIAAHGSHHLVAVTLGLFDDAAGLVQVNGSGLAPGQTVVVPKL